MTGEDGQRIALSGRRNAGQLTKPRKAQIEDGHD